MLLLLGTALAVTAAPADDEAGEDPGEPLDTTDYDLEHLPLASYGRELRLWIGATPPSFAKPWNRFFEMVIGVEANVRLTTPLPWLQPELRIAYDRAFDVNAELSLRGNMAVPTQTVITLGPRFGVDRGVYGGVVGGVNLLDSVGQDSSGVEVVPAVTVYGGYAFHLAEGMRGGPELTLGTRNTLAWRMEWGV